jgi:hypothetical protein
MAIKRAHQPPRPRAAAAPPPADGQPLLTDGPQSGEMVPVTLPSVSYKVVVVRLLGSVTDVWRLSVS